MRIQAYYNKLRLVYLQSDHNIDIFFMIPRRTKCQSMNYIIVIYSCYFYSDVNYVRTGSRRSPNYNIIYQLVYHITSYYDLYHNY